MSSTAVVTRLKALGEPRRLAIVRLLAAGPRNGVALLGDLRISQPNLSRHLAILRNAGVVRERRRGREALYALVPDPVLLAVLESLGEAPPMGSPEKMHEYASLHTEARVSDPDNPVADAGRGGSSSDSGAGEAPRGPADDRDDFQDWLL